jgi:hypothetical protein
MKKLITIILVLIGLQSIAQNIPPQAINFQGVAIDKNGIPVPGMDELGNPIQNSAIRVRFTILTGTATGNISYQEEHLTTTDEFGRFNLEIGRGTATNGVFSAINWGGDKHFLQVEVDLSALGTNYTLASVQEFLSVPYALYAKASGLSVNDLDTDPNNEIQTLTLSGNLLEISGGNSVNLPANTDNQTLSISGTTLTISGGNSITIPDAQTLTLTGNSLSISNGNTVNLPADSDNQNLTLSGSILGISNGNNITLPTPLDNDTANELQTLSIINSSLSISNGNTVTLPPDSDHQTLTLAGNTLSILNGNSIVLPPSLDNDSTNELQTLSLNNDTLSISDGNNIIIPVNTDNQTLSINSGTLTISRGNSISLPMNNDNDSTNEIQLLQLIGNTLSISGGNSISLPQNTSLSQTISRDQIRIFTQISSPSPTVISYVNAIRYCSDLVENGSNDWALASFEEIQNYMENYYASGNINTWVKLDKPYKAEGGNPLWGMRFSFNNGDGEFHGLTISSGSINTSTPLQKFSCHCFR